MTKYKGHTIRETSTTIDVERACFGRYYRAIAYLHAVEGPVFNTLGTSPWSWPTSIADAKRMISEAVAWEQLDETEQQLDKRGYTLLYSQAYYDEDTRTIEPHDGQWRVDADGDRENTSVMVGYSPTLRGCIELVDQAERGGLDA
ncbi:MAG: hypothetical protein CL759_06855 [Chloroflexi bacterium]|nr:hypothetical protein [Chloroflexota bacterium]|tara:strand:+ start:2205 stop:2639 length:435 start_codon:yes stop_codon:yes gene_type:complete